MPNAQKELVVSELRDIVSHSKGAILTDYRGLTVAEVTRLRKRLRDVDAEYHIVKNTLFKRALDGAVSTDLETLLKGPTAIAFAREDVVAPTKAVLDFLRELKKPEIKVKGGWIDGKVYSVDEVTALSKLPSKEQIISQLLGTLNGPASNFVGTLDGIIGEFVRTVQAMADKAAEGGLQAASAAPVAEAAPVEEAAAAPETAPAAEAVPAEATAPTVDAAPVAEEPVAAPDAEPAPAADATPEA